MGFGESILHLTGLENPWIAKGVAVGLVVLLLGKYLKVVLYNKCRENRRVNQEWTIQRNWQHRATRHSMKTNKKMQLRKLDEQHRPHQKPC
jgi:hypothetical protein